MKKHSFAQLVGFDRILRLMEAHHRMTGLLSAIMEADGTILVTAGWQEICLRYHRVHPNGCLRCLESEADGIRRRPPTPESPYRESVCGNGMRKVLLPIYIAGEHIATFVMGQFFYEGEKPASAYFRGLAEEFGFDPDGYFDALNRVPIVKREQVRSWLDYSGAVLTMMTEQGLVNMVCEREAMERKHAEQVLRHLNQDLEQKAAEQAATLTANKTAMIRENLLRSQAEERLGLVQHRLEELEEMSGCGTEKRGDSDREIDLLLIQRERQTAIEEMVGALSHQWRQPLNVIGLLIQELVESHAFGGLSRENLDQVAAKTMALLKQISRSIEDFRNFFKPGKEKAIFSVSYAIEKSLSFIEVSLLRRGITIERNISDDLSVAGYPYEYAQAVLNILNASKDMLLERRIPNAKVTISGAREGSRTIVIIGDNAGGLPENVMKTVSSPTFSAGPELDYSIIRLYMAKIIIERNMGGTFCAAATPDGTEFRIEV